VSSGKIDRLRVDRDPLASWLGQALQFSAELHRRERGLDGCIVNDVLPIGEILFPGLLRLAEVRLVTDLGDGEDRGRTREAHDGCDKQVALGVDIDKMKQMLQRVMKEA
jgi:inosine-uridine nucleoside N-ribohydrolase